MTDKKKSKSDDRDIFEKALSDDADITAARIAMTAPFLYVAGRSIRRAGKKIMRGEPPGVPGGAIGGLAAASATLNATGKPSQKKRNRK